MRVTPRGIVYAVLLVGLALVPTLAQAFAYPFLVTLFTRIVILSLAAVGLNLILGYGGMVSFGHAVYIGIGGYTVGILAHHGITNGFVQWPLAMLFAGLYALFVGAISLRTRGVYFIMITLAFAQLVYFVGVGLYEYGGDDGLTIYTRSQFAGLIRMSHKPSFYYLCLALLCLALFAVWRIANSRFGMVLRASKSNDRRANAIGLPTFRYRLTAFVISAIICGLAGALLATSADFISPAVMHWTRSGDLIIAVVLGGLGSLFGPVVGMAVFLLLEEVLSTITSYWQLVFGPMLLLLVLFAKRGIDGLIPGGRRG